MRIGKELPGHFCMYQPNSAFESPYDKHFKVSEVMYPALCGNCKVKVRKTSSSPLKSQIKGTFLLRRKGRFYKVTKTRHTRGNWWTFECKDIDSKQDVLFNFEMLGMLNALDSAASVMRDPKDILLMNLDNQGK